MLPKFDLPKLRLPEIKLPKFDILKSLGNLSKSIKEGFKKHIEKVVEGGKSIFSFFGEAFSKLKPKEDSFLMSPLNGFMTMIDEFAKKVKNLELGGIFDEERESEREESREETSQPEKPKNKILACKNFEECKQLLIKKGYVLDKATGNYINPRRLGGMRLLNESVVHDTIGNKKVRLKKSVMQRLKRADERFFADTGKHLRIVWSGRTNENQFNLYKRIKPRGGVVASPGNSFHEVCQAIDCGNWRDAEPYLLAEGFVGGSNGIPDDPAHFSIGEMRYKNDPLLVARAHEEDDRKKRREAA